MPSEVATLQQIVETTPGSETFYSKHRELQLVRQRTIKVENTVGHTVVVQDPVVYRFGPNGVLVVEPGQDELPDGPGGATQDVVAWLSTHPRLNRRFQWQGHEPGQALPLDGDYLKAVTRATAHGDVKALRMLKAEEEGSHARPLLLSAVNNALEALEANPLVETPPDEDPLPEDYDRVETLEWLATNDIVVASDATDQQLVAMVEAALIEKDDAA